MIEIARDAKTNTFRTVLHVSFPPAEVTSTTNEINKWRSIPKTRN